MDVVTKLIEKGFGWMCRSKNKLDKLPLDEAMKINHHRLVKYLHRHDIDHSPQGLINHFISETKSIVILCMFHTSHFHTEAHA